MKLLFFGSAAAAYSLCGNWAQSAGATKCSINHQCCVDDGAAIPSCTGNNPTIDTSGSLVTQEEYQFAGDGAYKVILRIATGQACPLSATSGTVLFSVETQGTFTREGNNTDLGNGWEKVRYTPTRFITTIVKSNQDSPFKEGVPVNGGKFASPCMEMSMYLNNLEIGCPCNRTWAPDGIPQDIEIAKCPLMNSTNGSMVPSCPESYYFDTSSKYGNVRITNQTATAQNGNATRLLEVTLPNTNMTLGYATSVSFANFTADDTCPQVIDGSSGAPTPAQSDAFVLGPSLIFAFIVALF